MEQSTEGKMIADTTLRHGEVDADLIAVLATQAGLPVVDRLELPERVAQFKPVPSSLAGKVRDVLSQRYPNGLYAHQAEAIERALAGADICIATPTASGKTLAFTTVADLPPVVGPLIMRVRVDYHGLRVGRREP